MGSRAKPGPSGGTVSRWICFTFLAAAQAYACFNQGGRTAVGWNTSLLILSAAAVLYLLTVPLIDQRPLTARLLSWCFLLPPAYVAFQLLPLPLGVVRVLSPARAGLVDSLAQVTQSPSFATISIDPASTSIFLLRTLAYSLMALLIFELSRYIGRRRSWVPVIPLIAIAAFEAVLGLFQFANGVEVSGTYRSHDHFAGLLEMALPLAVAYGISRLTDSRSPKSLPVSKAVTASVAFGLAAAMLVGLVYSLSKMGFVAGLGGLAAIGVLAAFWKLKGPGRWLAVGGLAITFILVFAFLPTDQLANAYGSFFSNDPSSAEGRAPVWSDSRHLLRAYPAFGTGLGTFGTAFLKYQTSDVDEVFSFAHNDYIELASELGAVGFLIFAGIFVMALVKAVRAAGSDDWNTALLGLGCAGAMAAIGIHSLVDFNLYIPANALVLSWIIGISISLPSPEGTREELPAPRALIWNRLSFRYVPLLFTSLLVFYASGWIAFETRYRGDPRAQAAFCRFGICGTETVFADEPEEDSAKSATASLASLVEAVKREPASPNRWGDLAEGLLREGHEDEARYCYSNALALGPQIPPILFRSANFYRVLRDDPRALGLGAQLMDKSDIYRPILLDWYRDQRFSVSDILSRGLPAEPRPAQAYLRYWTAQGNVENAETTWNWILSHHYADEPTTRDYINFLFGNAKYQEAATNWALFLGDHRKGYREANWLFNGDFENEPTRIPLDWDLMKLTGQVETSLDSTVAHTGTHSLRIHFAGTENVSYADTEKTSVPPGTYRFTAFIRTENITTDRGVAFHIFDAEKTSRLDVKSEQFLGTNPWTKVEQTIRVGEATKLLAIQIVREPTMKLDNKIGGAAWIDTVSLSKIG